MSIESIRARLEAATPGPWNYGDRCVYSEADDLPWNDYDIAYYRDPAGEMPLWSSDAALIAHTPTDLRALLKVAEAARPGCCDELDADCDVRCDCAWGEVCAALTELEAQE